MVLNNWFCYNIAIYIVWLLLCSWFLRFKRALDAAWTYFFLLEKMCSTLFQKICSKWTYGCRLYPNIFFTLVYTYSVLNRLVDISKLKKMSHYVHSPRFFASHNENITLKSIQFKMIRLNNNNERCIYTDFGGHF